MKTPSNMASSPPIQLVSDKPTDLTKLFRFHNKSDNCRSTTLMKIILRENYTRSIPSPVEDIFYNKKESRFQSFWMNLLLCPWAKGLEDFKIYGMYNYMATKYVNKFLLQVRFQHNKEWFFQPREITADHQWVYKDSTVIQGVIPVKI